MSVESYDLIVVGTSFAASFFLHGYLQSAPEKARILVLERGAKRSHAELLALRNTIRNQGDQTYQNTTKHKPWWYAPTFGGTSNIWYGNTPRMAPEDFELKRRYGVGEDWPFGYDELEPYYAKAESLMHISGEGGARRFPRSQDYPLPAHQLSEPEKLLKKAQPEDFLCCPTARASRGVPDQRVACCTSFVCNFCPVDAKFTVLNGLAKLYTDPRVTLELGSHVRSLELEGGQATGVAYSKGHDEKRAKGALIALGANALFNPQILLASGLRHPALGEYLHEQVGCAAEVHLDGVEGFQGSTSCTGLNFRLATGEHRKERGALMLETYSVPKLRIEPGKWRQLLRVTGVFEDLPRLGNNVTLGDGDKPKVHYAGYGDYAKRSIARFEQDLALLLEGLPVERVFVKKPRATEGHILGTARMGADAKTSVVDGDQVHHQLRNVLVLGGSSFPTGAPANPSLTIAALSLRSAARLVQKGAP